MMRHRCAAAALASLAALGSFALQTQAATPLAANSPAQTQTAPDTTAPATKETKATTATPGETTAMSGDPAAGRAKTAMCAGCHEIPGWQTAFPEVYKVPRIIGQHQPYLVHALQAYKSGDRSHPSMRAIAASLSDNDMADLAAYYSQPPGKTAAK